MHQHNESSSDADVSRDRLARLREAGLVTGESLDARAVLQEVLENARAMAGARYGVIATVGDDSRIKEVVSSGFTEEEHRRLRDLPGPLTLRDLTNCTSDLGIPCDSRGAHGSHKSFLAEPIRYRGAHVGNFLLSGKEAGQAFSEEDQRVLVIFASQAATVIANGRAHRDEQQARADLEALLDTAPVGLVVMDAKSGEVLSANREAWRVVGAPRDPEGSPEQLLEVLKVRRGDGREIPLERGSLALELNTTTPVRAEEIVIDVPGGRSVTMLVNTMPVHQEGSEARTVVVTLQDMTPLEELERMRAEFLGIVGHELRAPLLSVKGCTAMALGSRAVPDPAELHQIFRMIDKQVERMRGLIGDLLDASRIEAGTLPVEPESQSVVTLVDEARNTFLSAGGKNPLRIDIPPDIPKVQADRRRIVQVLSNLLANASRHSPESAPIRIAAADRGLHVAIAVTDKGAGVRADLLPHLFRKYFLGEGRGGRRGTERTGLGLAICKGIVEAHGGRIWVESEGPGRGARFTFTIPSVEERGARP